MPFIPDKSTFIPDTEITPEVTSSFVPDKPKMSGKITPLTFIQPAIVTKAELSPNRKPSRFWAFKHGLETGATGMDILDEKDVNYPGASLAGQITGSVLPYIATGGSVAGFAGIPMAQEALRQTVTPKEGEQLTPFTRTAKVGVAGAAGYGIGKYFKFAELVKYPSWIRTLVERSIRRAIPTGVISGIESLYQQGLSGEEPDIKQAGVTAAFNTLTVGILGGLADMAEAKGLIMDEGLRLAQQKAGFLEPKPTKISFEQAKKLVMEAGGTPEKLSPVLQRAVYDAKKEAAIQDFMKENNVSRKMAQEVMSAKNYRQTLASLDKLISDKVRHYTGRKPVFSWQSGLDYELDFSKMTPQQAVELRRLYDFRRTIREGRDPINGMILDKLSPKTAITSQAEFNRKINAPLEETTGLLKGDVEHLRNGEVKQITIPGYTGPIRLQARQIANSIKLKDVDGKEVNLVGLPATSQKLIEQKLAESLMSGKHPEEVKAEAQQFAQELHAANAIILEGTKGEISEDTVVYWGLHNKRYKLSELAGLLKQGEFTTSPTGELIRQSIPPESWDIKFGLAKGQMGQVKKIRALLTELYDRSGIIENMPPTQTQTAPLPTSPTIPATEETASKIAELVKPKEIQKEGTLDNPVKGDIWDKHAQGDYVVIGTNQGGVHGRGLAKQAADKGLVLKGHSGTFDFSAFANKVLSVAVKRHWSDKTTGKNLDLMSSEIDKLVAFAQTHSNETIWVPYLGMGFGEGSKAEIYPILNKLAALPNVKFIARGEGVVKKYADTFKPGAREDKAASKELSTPTEGKIAVEDEVEEAEAPKPTMKEEIEKLMPSKVELKGSKLHGYISDNIKNYLQILQDMDTALRSKVSIPERIDELQLKLSPSKAKTKTKGLIVRYQESIAELLRLQNVIKNLKLSIDPNASKKIEQAVAQANWLMNPSNSNSPERLKKQIGVINKTINDLVKISNEMDKNTTRESDAVYKLYKNELDLIRNQMTAEEQATVEGKTADELAKIVSDIENKGTYQVNDIVRAQIIKDAKTKEFDYEPVQMPVEEEPVEGTNEVAPYLNRGNDVVPDVPLEDNEELVESYDSNLNVRKIEQITLNHAVVNDVENKQHVLTGNFSFVTDKDKANQVKLANKKDQVWITKDALRDLLINEKEKVTIYQLRIFNETGSALDPAEIARSFFNLFKATDGKEVKMTNEFGKPEVHIKEAVLVQRFFVSSSEYLNWMKNKLGETIEKVTEPVPIPDDIITQITSEPDYRRYAQTIAGSNVRLLQTALFEQLMKELGKKKLAQEKYTLIAKWMPRASQEVRVVMDYKDYIEGKLRWEPSEIGLGGPHHPSDDPEFPDAERDTYIEDMVQIHKAFNIPFVVNGQPVDENTFRQSLMAGRLPMSFMNILSHPNVLQDTTLIQRQIVYNKTENVTGLLLDLIDLGAFRNADMFNNIMEGYEHRVHGPVEVQKPGKRRSRQQVKTPSVPGARYRTYSEFVWQTNRKQKVAIEDFFANAIDYIADYMMLAQQIRNINLLKVKINPRPPLIKGFETNTEVNKLRTHLRMVEFTNSEVIQALSDKTKLDPNALLALLNYVQDKESPGLAQHFKDSFHPPYVTRELYDFLQAVYSPVGINRVNRWMNVPKMIVTMVPTDSIWRFLSAVIVEGMHRPHTLAFLPFEFAGAVMQGLGRIGPQILAGKYDINKVFEAEDYGELADFLRLGGTVHYAQALEGFFDVEQLGNIPELNSFWQNAKEYYKSWAGVNTAIFQHFILKKIYSVWRIQYRRMMEENPSMDKETAMRLTSKVLNTASAMLSANIWGDKGNWFNLVLFSRSLTTSLGRILSAISYPVLKDTGLYKFHTGEGEGGGKGLGLSKLLNPIFWGETAPKDMLKISMAMQNYVVALFILAWTVNSTLQYVLSFFENPSIPDEHGELALKPDGSLNLLAKRRFMVFNENWKQFSPRLPWRNWDNKRMYLDLQLLKEIPETIRILTGPDAWLRAKLNMVFRMTAELIMNKDRQGNKIQDPNLSPEENAQLLSKWMKDNYQIIQFRKQAGVTDESGDKDELVNNSLLALSFFGVGSSLGQAAEPGTTWKEAIEDRKKVAKELFKKSQALQKNPPSELSPKEIWNRIDEQFSPESGLELYFKKTAPVMYFKKKNIKNIAK